MLPKWIRLTTFLLLCASIVPLSSCRTGKEPGTVTEAPADVPSDTEETENPNAGKTAPYLVETVYPVSDTVVAAADVLAYGADPTGKEDATGAFRQALADVGKAGGGTVWVPAGSYRITGTLEIPPLVTLRGDRNDPDRADLDGKYGTVILACPKQSEKEDTGLFVLAECSGVRGLTVYYPDQSLDAVKPYSPTFCLKGNTRLRTVRDVTLINSYIGAVVEGVNESTNFIGIRGTVLKKGLEVGSSADVGIFEDIVFSPDYWANAGGAFTPADRAGIVAWCKKNGSAAFLLHDLEQQQFMRIRAEGFAYGILFPAEPTRWMASGPIFGLIVRDCVYGVCAEDGTYVSPSGYAANICPTLTAIDCRCGYLISASHIEGSEYAVYNGCPAVKGADGTVMQAYIHLADTVIEGETAGNVSFTKYGEETDLSSLALPVKTSARVTGTAFAAVKPGDTEKNIQDALDRVGKEGGGAVYLPAGNYEIASGLTVPANTVLIGAAGVPQRIPNVGTVLWCRQNGAKTDISEDLALVTLDGKNAGVSGVYLMYDRNIAAVNAGSEIAYYPFAVRGNAEGVFCVNCCISGATHGIDFRDCDGHLVEGLFSGCFYSHAEVSGDGGTVRNCLANGTVLYRTNGVVPTDEAGTMFPNFFGKYGLPGCRYVTVGDGTGERIENVFAYGVKHLIDNRGGEEVAAVNLGSDNLGSFVLSQTRGSMTAVNVIVTSVETFSCKAGDLTVINPLRNSDHAFPDAAWEDGKKR